MNDCVANWSAPANVRALTTSRVGGYSQSPFDKNNLALHVGDDAEHVQRNRQSLKQRLLMPNDPVWLEQTHSTHCVMVDDDNNRNADASITRRPNTPLAIMTADCLPILLCDRNGTEIAAIHAGWKGLAYGIVEQTLQKMESQPETLLAWIGPAICQRCYQVGREMEEAFTNRYSFVSSAFEHKDNSCYADLPGLAELILKSHGVEAVFQSKACTFERDDAFYSYRREAKTGRIATLIWRD